MVKKRNPSWVNINPNCRHFVDTFSRESVGTL